MNPETLQKDPQKNNGSSQPSTNQVTPPSTLTTTPLPASQKVYLQGSRSDIQVPVREISLTPTQGAPGTPDTANPPVPVYDPSGPYTDPEISIDVRRGLAPLRRQWILDRHDVEELSEISSLYGRQRAIDPSLQPIRFASKRNPLSRSPG